MFYHIPLKIELCGTKWPGAHAGLRKKKKVELAWAHDEKVWCLRPHIKKEAWWCNGKRRFIRHYKLQSVRTAVLSKRDAVSETGRTRREKVQNQRMWRGRLFERRGPVIWTTDFRYSYYYYYNNNNNNNNNWRKIKSATLWSLDTNGV